MTIGCAITTWSSWVGVGARPVITRTTGEPWDQGHVFVQLLRTRMSTTKPDSSPSLTGAGCVTTSPG